MKSTTLLILGALVAAPAIVCDRAAAQETVATLTADTAPASTYVDGYFVVNGRLMLRSGNQITPVDSDVALPNGAQVSTTGRITLPNGTTAALAPNQILTASGGIISSPHNPGAGATMAPGAPAGAESARNPTESGSTAVQGYFVRNNRLMMRRGNQITPVSTDVTLANGTRIDTTGRVTLPTRA